MAWHLDGAKQLSETMLKFVNWTLRNKLQWNFNRYSNIFIEEITFENVVCKMSAIFSRPQCVKSKQKRYIMSVILFHFQNVGHKTVKKFWLPERNFGCNKSYLRGQSITVKSTLVRVMAWCCQTTSHYLDQCLIRSLMPDCPSGNWWTRHVYNFADF